MNLSYFISVTGSKILALAALLSLSYFLTEQEFGQFTLISTNALFVQLLFGSWITSSANKYISLGYSNNNEISLILSILSIVFLILLLLTISYIYITDSNTENAFSTLYFSCAIIVFDIILAILNGSGSASHYARLSLLRAFGSFIFPVAVAAVGGSGAQVAMASASAVVLSVLACKPVRASVASAAIPKSLIKGIKRYLSHGIAGGLVLGVYILINAPIRNLIANFEGVAAAGHWSITSDVLYGPLAIAGTIATLSASRQLHRWAKEANQNKEDDASIAYFESLLLVSLPYAAVGYFVASDITPLIFSPGLNAEIAALAPQICIQNGAILLIYGLSYVAFTKERWLALCFAIALATFLPLIAAVLILVDAVPWFDLVTAVTIANIACTIIITGCYLLAGIIQVRPKILAIIISLSGIVVLFIDVLSKISPTSVMTLVASILGGLLYIACAYRLGVLNIEPTRTMEN